jgi:transcriptional regulator GlxA family with amidase domain
VLSALIQRGIVYRVLRGPAAARLRAVATLGDQSHPTSKAIAWVRANYAKPLRVAELAQLTGWVSRRSIIISGRWLQGVLCSIRSSFALRLHARMLTDGLDAASAAFEGGYESVSQFNREYSRFFGQPPIRDVRKWRLAGSAA